MDTYENFHRNSKCSSHYYSEFSSQYTLNLRCNICSQEIDEKEVESHVNMQQHKENKLKISKPNESGSDISVVKMWYNSSSNS
ncbi:MAG: hypothetical protein WAN47_04020 [Nitrosotalea sp.]